MRTTFEISDAQWARLKTLAAERGLKGFSELIGEALDLYFQHCDEHKQASRSLLAWKGTISDGEASKMHERIDEVWTRWESSTLPS